MIIAGVIVLALGYLMPVRKKDIDTESLLISEDEIRKMVDRELDNVKTHISDIVDETVTYSMEKTERSMERVANEKIMAVNEYSDTVLEEINKNHKEVIFLYDMLNDKHENLKAAVIDAAQTSEEIRQTLKDAEVTAQEASGAIEQVESIADEAKEAVKKTMDEMTEIAGMLKEAVYERVSSGGYPAEPAYEDNVYEETDENFAQDEDFADEEIEEEIFAEEEDFTNERLMDYRESMDFGRSRAAEKMRFDDDEEDYFTPITPPRVNIIHDPEGDYVADPPLAEPAPEKTQVRRPAGRTAAPKKTASRPAPSKEAKPARSAKRSMEPDFPTARMADAKSVNIQFANGRDNGRNSNERILELHKAGKSNMAIAKELGLGIGEVKLVIDLFEGL